jgi:hypothetical protein
VGTDDTTSDPHEVTGGADVEEQPDDSSHADAGWHLPRELVRPGAIALACVVVAAIVSVFAFTSHGSSKPSPATAAAAGTQPGAATSPGTGHVNGSAAQPGAGARPAKAAAVAVTADGISKAAVPLPPAHKHAVARWNSGPGGAALAVVTNQLGTVSQIGGAGLFATMKQGCATLGTDIAAAQAAAAIPDPAMQKAYRHALAQLATAAATCRSAITSWPEGDEDIQTHENKPLLQTAVAEMSAGARRLYLATEHVRMLHS